MTRHFSPPPQATTLMSTILIDAARCWRDARDRGESVQPCLTRLLAAHDCEMLAPVLASLYQFYEVALRRPIAVGGAMILSEDEHLLLGMVDDTRSRQCLDCPKEMATTFDCALCSTRIMLALATGRPAARSWQ